MLTFHILSMYKYKRTVTSMEFHGQWNEEALSKETFPSLLKCYNCPSISNQKDAVISMHYLQIDYCLKKAQIS